MIKIDGENHLYKDPSNGAIVSDCIIDYEQHIINNTPTDRIDALTTKVDELSNLVATLIHAISQNQKS